MSSKKQKKQALQKAGKQPLSTVKRKQKKTSSKAGKRQKLKKTVGAKATPQLTRAKKIAGAREKTKNPKTSSAKSGAPQTKPVKTTQPKKAKAPVKTAEKAKTLKKTAQNATPTQPAKITQSKKPTQPKKSSPKKSALQKLSSQTLEPKAKKFVKGQSLGTSHFTAKSKPSVSASPQNKAPAQANKTKAKNIKGKSSNSQPETAVIAPNLTSDDSAGFEAKPSASLSLSLAQQELLRLSNKEKEEKMILKDMEGRKYCAIENCDRPALAEDHCRLHFFAFFKLIKKKKYILKTNFLEESFRSLIEAHSSVVFDYLFKDLRSDHDFSLALEKLLSEGADLKPEGFSALEEFDPSSDTL